MIIDAHVHLNDDAWSPSAFRLGLGRIISATLGKDSGELADPAELIETIGPSLEHPTGELLLADMEEAGVDASVIFTVDYALGVDEPCSGTPECVPIAEVNRIFGEIAARLSPGESRVRFRAPP